MPETMISRVLNHIRLVLPDLLELFLRHRTIKLIGVSGKFSMRTQTDTNKVGIGEGLFEVSQESLSVWIVGHFKVIGISCLTITEIDILWPILRTKVITISSSHRHRVTLTISQNHTLNFLEFVPLFEFRNDAVETSETLVQRSTTHTELVRDTVVNVTPDTIHNKEQIPHVVVKFLLRYTTTEKIQQTEVSSHVETFVLTFFFIR